MVNEVKGMEERKLSLIALGKEKGYVTYEQIADIVPKEKSADGQVIEVGSKPRYFIFIKGEFFTSVQGIDLPKLKEEINKSYAKFEETTV